MIMLMLYMDFMRLGRHRGRKRRKECLLCDNVARVYVMFCGYVTAVVYKSVSCMRNGFGCFECLNNLL